jgi:hypothetical protein
VPAAEPSHACGCELAPETSYAALAGWSDAEDIMVKLVRTVEAVIFYSRWLLAPLYLGLRGVVRVTQAAVSPADWPCDPRGRFA